MLYSMLDILHGQTYFLKLILKVVIIILELKKEKNERLFLRPFLNYMSG